MKQQPHTGNKKNFIPDIILVKEAEKTVSEIEDVISPEIRLQMQRKGTPRDKMLEISASELKTVQITLPAQFVSIGDTKFKYSPVAVHASIESLPNLTNMKFDGLTPYEMYKMKIEEQIESIM